MVIKKLCLLLTLLVALSGAAGAQQRPQLAPLPIEEALATLSFHLYLPTDLSPDGKWVAYTLYDSRRRQATNDPKYRIYSPTGVHGGNLGTDVWLTEVATGKTQNLTGGQGASWGPVWSPDGARLAFCSDRGGLAQIWVWEKASGQMRRVSEAVVRVSLQNVVRWTPDGSKLLIKLLPEGMTVEEAALMLMTPPQMPDAGLPKEPGSTVTIYRASLETKASPEQARAQRAQRDSYTNVFLADLGLIDVASGKVQRIAQRQKIRWCAFSPDGARVAFTTSKGLASDKEYQGLYDLWVVPATGGQARAVATDLQMVGGEGVSWSPDGQRLAYLTYGDLAKGDCFVVAADGQSPPRLLTPGAHPNFGHELRGPLWDERGEAVYLLNPAALWRASAADGTARELVKIPEHKLVEIIAPAGGQGRFWSPDGGRSLVLITRDDEQMRDGFYRVDLATGQATRLTEERKSYGAYGSGVSPMTRIDVSADGRRVIFAAQGAQQSEDLWLVENADFRAPRRLTDINPQLTRYVMGDSRVIEWRGVDGQKLRGALLLPAGYKEGQRYPLVVFQYPTDMKSRFANNFGLGKYGSGMDNWQLLATRGYAVLLPDMPRDIREPLLLEIPKLIMPGVDKVIEMGIADPERLGVTGYSLGGYSVYCLLVQTTRFKAAVAGAGPGNWISAYSHLEPNGTSGYTGQIEAGTTGGTLWERRDRFIENSPVFYLDRVRTPLLIVHGSLDPGASPALSDEMFVCLRRLGREVEYAKYEGEGHTPDIWRLANQVDYLKRMIGWFDARLKPAAPATTAPSSVGGTLPPK